MKRAILFSFVAASCLALTPAERKILVHAKSQLEQAQQESVTLKSELNQARSEVDQSKQSASIADQKSLAAENQVKAEHTELVKAVSQNQQMSKIVNQDKKWFGLGRIFYGFADLLKHLLILGIAIAAIAIILSVLSIVFPELAPVLGFFKWVWGKIVSVFTKKQ